MENGVKINVIKGTIISLLGVLIISCFSLIIFLLTKINSYGNTEPVAMTKRDYLVLVTGTPENKDFLSQVYEGATIVSHFYDSAIQFHIPDVGTAYSYEALLNYAGYINADCVIAFIEPGEKIDVNPENCHGKKIPLITVGYYSPETPQISHIGVNYSELGTLLGEEAISCLNGEGNVYILNAFNYDDLYNSSLVTNLTNTIKGNKGIHIVKTSSRQETSLSLEDEIRQQIASTGKIDVIIALSAADTILAVQTVLDLNLKNRTKIIGFGDGRDVISYFEKGIVYELLALDAVSVGKNAMQEFFEYQTNGAANNYVTAEIKMIKQGGTDGR